MNFKLHHPIEPAIAKLIKDLALLVAQDQLSLKDFGDQCHDMGFSAGRVDGAKLVASDVERTIKSK